MLLLLLLPMCGFLDWLSKLFREFNDVMNHFKMNCDNVALQLRQSMKTMKFISEMKFIKWFVYMETSKSILSPFEMDISRQNSYEFSDDYCLCFRLSEFVKVSTRFPRYKCKCRSNESANREIPYRYRKPIKITTKRV